MRISSAIVCFAMVGCLLATAHAYREAEMLWIVDPPGTESTTIAEAIAANGTAAAGTFASEFGWEAHLWTGTNGTQPLGDLAGGNYFSSAQAVSSNGLVVAGYSDSINSSASGAYMEAFRWTPATGMVGLGDLSGGPFHSRAYGISADGSTIIGHGERSYGREAFRWTQATGMQGLGFIALPTTGYSTAKDVSDDGSVIVGWSENANFRAEPFRWTAETGMVALGYLPDAWSPYGWGEVISGDGRVLYGRSRNRLADMEVFRWTPEEGMVGLGFIDAGTPTDTSYDGSIMLLDRTQSASLWDACRGRRDFRTMLEEDYDLTVTGLQLHRVLAMSSDGRAFCGWGVNPTNDLTQGWVIYLPPASEVFGDLTDDELIDAADAVVVANALRGPGDANPLCLLADLTDDGFVDLLDYAALQRLIPPACDPPVALDLNGDCQQGGADIAFFADCLAGPTPAPEACTPADLDHDGDVDLADYARFQMVMVGS